MRASDCLLWFDTEYSTDVLDRASLLQVGLVVTDASLRVLTPAQPPPGLLPHERRKHGISMHLAIPSDAIISDFVRGMPDLLARCASHGRSRDEVDALLAAWVDATLGPPAALRDRPTMAGNSVHMDWYLARRELPLFSQRIHYRLLDVTALKIEWKGTFGGRKFDKDDPKTIAAALPIADLEGETRHDAYYDAQASMAELAFYRAGLRLNGG